MKPTNIVMLVKDRWTLTLQAFNSLYRHTAPDEFTLTIIDDDSSIPVHRALRTWVAAPMHYKNAALLQINRSKAITGQARNLGVYWSEKYFGRGEFLYLSDNDVYFRPHWLETLIAVMHSSSQWGVVAGSTHPFHGRNYTHETYFANNDSAPPHLRGQAVQVFEHDAVSGYSHLMRWETWDKYGPLDARAPGTGQSEDFKFCQQIIQAGGRVGSVWPEVVYACGLTDTFGKPAVGADKMHRYPGVIQE